MIRTRVKICGITDVEAARAAAAGGADAIGLVFVEQSPRCVTLRQAEQIIAALPAFVEPIGLFADHALQQVRQVADRLRLRTVQLHGDEQPDALHELAPLRVIKALHFDEDYAEDTLAPWLPAAANLAAILWDTPPDERAHLTGGSGRAFNWEALASFLDAIEHADPPQTVLAGGLHADNVAQAVQAVRPYAVDVSSGVERARGRKDPTAVAAFCRAVREADATLVRQL
jgi:phosphoribosylanthranilate isomerase